MVDQATGSGGTLRIVDTGSTVQFWLGQSVSTTNSTGLPFRIYVNGVYWPVDPPGWGSFAWASGGGFRLVAEFTVSYSQTVAFAIGNTATSGFGGPTNLSASISRAGAPPAPTVNGYGFDMVTDTTARFRFSSTGDGGSPITSWAFELSTRSDFHPSQTALYSSSGTTMLSGLVPGTTYYARARGQNAYGISPWSETATTTTLRRPLTPLAPTLVSKTSTSAIVSFVDGGTGGSAITGRKQQISTVADFSTVLQERAGATSNQEFTGLERNTPYYFRYQTSNVYGASDWSPVLTVTTDTDLPSAPSSYGVSDVASTTAYTTSPAVSDNGGAPLLNLRAEFNTSASSSGSTVVTAGAFRPALLSGLTIGATYYVRLAVANQAGWGPYGPWVSFSTKNNVPNPPGSVVVNTITNTTARVNWTAPTTLNGSTILNYQLRVAINADFSAGLQTFTIPAGTLLQNLDGLQPGTTYYAQLWANTNNGNGSMTTPAAFTTTGTAPNASSLWMRISGVWKPGTLWHRVSGTWRQVTLWQRISGVWRKL